MDKKNNSRIYYTIGEVARLFHINESKLRFWEKEFDIIAPRKSEKGTRLYSPDDIENIRLILYLTEEKGLTLEGAKKKLKENKEGVIKIHDIVHRLQNIQSELISIRDAFSVIEPETGEESFHTIP